MVHGWVAASQKRSAATEPLQISNDRKGSHCAGTHYRNEAAIRILLSALSVLLSHMHSGGTQ